MRIRGSDPDPDPNQNDMDPKHCLFCIFKLFDHVLQNIRFKIKAKGIISVLSSDRLFKDGNVRFTTVPLKALHDQV